MFIISSLVELKDDPDRQPQGLRPGSVRVSAQLSLYPVGLSIQEPDYTDIGSGGRAD